MSHSTRRSCQGSGLGILMAARIRRGVTEGISAATYYKYTSAHACITVYRDSGSRATAFLAMHMCPVSMMYGNLRVLQISWDSSCCRRVMRPPSGPGRRACVHTTYIHYIHTVAWLHTTLTSGTYLSPVCCGLLCDRRNTTQMKSCSREIKAFCLAARKRKDLSSSLSTQQPG